MQSLKATAPTLLCMVLLAVVLSAAAKAVNEDVKPEEKAAPTIGEGYKQKWAYVDVRPQAHMFWWLYYTSHKDGHLNRPLIMWLNGGPGAGSTGYGNFDIMGPQNAALEKRNTTWVQEVSVLYVDNPVGAGYSYVDSVDALTTDVDEIALDLLTLYKEFLRANPEFKTVPFYIFGQSYGGKMAAQFAKRLHASIQAGELEAKLEGFAMGNAWISPVDSTMTWGPLLYWMSVVDEPGLNAIQEAAGQCKDAADNKEWYLSTQLWRNTQRVLGERSNYVDFYNILNYRVFSKAQEELAADDRWMEYLVNPSPQAVSVSELMNTVVKKHLGIIPDNVSWGAQSGLVFQRQEGDFMKPVINIGQRRLVFQKQEGDFMKPVIKTVDELLKTTSMDVIVYQGQLDLICDTKGAMDWVQKMTWGDLGKYNSAPRLALTHPTTKQTETFVKAYKQFKFYWNLKEGHAVPRDSVGALRMLQRIIAKTDK